MDLTLFESRKREHIQLALNPAHQAVGLGRLDAVRLVHEALPDVDFNEVSLESACLGQVLPTPFYIAGMTAGHPDAVRINETLARACQRRGWAMGVGSQRRELEGRPFPGAGSTPSEADDAPWGGSVPRSIDDWRRLRDLCPDLVLFANLGISQIRLAKLKDIQRLVRDLGARALAVHANALQEALQPEGTPQFRGGLSALRRLCGELDARVILKETGCGFSGATLRRIAGLGLAAVDVSGLGGTHWGRIEGKRAEAESLQARAAVTFAGWGESTVDSVLAGADALAGSGTAVWASGGIRSGLDAAKLIALGAERVGYAQPALEAALQGDKAIDGWMAQQEFELKVALFCTGSRSLTELRRPGNYQLMSPGRIGSSGYAMERSF